MSVETEERVVECLSMAREAADKADAAVSPAETRFWLRMKERWLRLAQTYRDTKQLAAEWRGAPASGAASVKSIPTEH